MTVASEQSRSGPYIGNGVTTVFGYGFRILDEAHIRVVRMDGPDERVMTLGADYSVSGVGDEGGGSVTMTVAPTATQTITILRDVPFTQETDLENQGPYYAETIEASLDLAAMRDQQLKEGLSRALVTSETSEFTGLVVPDPEAGKYLKWSQDGTGLENAELVSVGEFAIATQSEAEGSTRNDVLMTPLRGAQQTAARLGVPPAFFGSKADATAFAAPAIIPFLYTDGRLAVGGGGRGYWSPVAGNVMPAHGEYILSGGRYFEPSPQGCVFFSQFGAVSGADCSSAFQRAFDFAAAKSIMPMFLENGQFLLNSQLPQLTIPYQIMGSGRGGISSTTTSICRRYNEADPARGVFAFADVGGAKVENLSIIAQDGGSGGCGLSFNSFAVNTGYCTGRDLYISADAGSKFNLSAFFSGANRLIGARSNALYNCQLFGGVTGSLWLESCIHFRAIGIETIEAGGDTGLITITGGNGDYATTTHPRSEDIEIVAEQINGLSLDYCKAVRVQSTGYTGHVLNTANVTNTRVNGPLRSDIIAGLSVQNNWEKSSCFYNGSNMTETSATSGYLYREDGRIEQWMQVNISNAAVAYNFPIAFPTKCLTCEVTPKGLTAGDQVSIASGGVTVSQVSLVGSGSITAFVRATGY